MALPSQKESLNKLVGFAEAADKRRKAQAITPSMTGVNQTSVEIESFEEAMNVAMTAIIGGPSHVAKDFSTLQSIAKSKDNIYGIISSQKDIVNNINETLATVSENIRTITDGFQTFDPIVSSWEDFMCTIDEIRDKIVKEKSKGDKVQLIQLAAGDANVGELLKSLQDFDDSSLAVVEKIVTELNKLNSIDLSKFKENIQVLDDDAIKNLADKFDAIKDLYEKHVADAANAAAQGQHDLEVINETNDRTTEVVVEGKKPDKKQLEEATTTYEGLASTILAGAFVMIIGALIIKAFPEFPMLALKFAATLTLFMAAVMTPLVLADVIMSKYGSKGTQNFDMIGDIIATAAFVMIIGGLFMKIKDMPEKSLEFTKQLTIFLVATISALALVTRLAKPELLASVKDMGNLIVLSAIVMIIGALFMQIDWMPKNALKFGVTLGLFMAVVLGPLMLLSFIGGNKKMQSDIKGVGNLIITCTIVMMIGALFMLLDNGKFVKNALMFGVILSLFIGLVLLPFIILKPLIGMAEHTLKDITRLITVCTIIMLIGAAFVLLGGGKFTIAALTFAIVLTFFITLCILPLLILKPFIQQGLKILRDVTLFVMVSTIIMLIGAFLILNHPEYVWASLKFGLVLALFIAGVLLPVIALSKFTNNALKEIGKVALFITISAATMMIGALFMNKGYGWAAIGFTVVFGIFMLAMTGIMFLISKIPNLQQAVANAAMLGIAIGLLSIAFTIMAFSMKVLTIGDFIKFLICTTLIAAAFAILGIPEVAAFVGLGSVVAALMGVALTLLSGAFAILHFAMTVSDPLTDFMKLAGALIVAGVVFALLGAMSPLIFFGSIAGGAMGIALTILSGAFAVLHYSMLVSEPWADFSKLILALVVAGVVFSLLGALSPLIIYGSIAAGAMSIALMLLGAAFLVLHECVGTDEIHPWEDFTKLALTIVIAGVVFTALGLLYPFILLGSISAAAMSAVLMLVAVSFNVVHSLLEDKDPVADMLVMVKAIGIMGIMFLALGALIPAAIIGMIALAISTPLALGLAYCVKQMAIATILAAMMPDPGKAAGKIGAFFSLVWSFPSPFRIWRMYIRFGAGAGLAIYLSHVLSMMGAAIQSIANLKVPTEWNENGDPINFRNLTDQDFKNAGDNVARIITSLGDALIGVYEKAPHLFDNGNNSIIYTVLRASMYMGLVISYIARGLQSYANLLIPDEWNNEGKPIHFVPFEQEDFVNAANGIKTVLFTLGGAILDFIRENPDLVAYMEETRGGFLGLSKNPSKFASVCIAGKTIGDLIGGIAQGLTAYANMMYPVHWNKEGKPDRFEPMTDAMIQQAKVRIVDILTDMTNAISAAYDRINGTGFFARIFGSPKKVKEKIECFTSVGSIISSIAEGLSKYAALMIPDQWNKDGNPVHFIRMSDTDINNAKANIIEILRSMALAVNDAYWSIPGSASQIKERIEAFVPIGNLISSFAIGLQAYAQLLVPVKWDKEGKPVKFEKMSNWDIIMAGYNIGLILKTMARAVWRAYDTFQQGVDEDGKKVSIKPDDIAKIVNGFKPIGDLVANTAQGLHAYASLLIPDRWNKDGVPTHYHKLPETFFNDAARNIGRILVHTAFALEWVYYTNKEMFEGKNPIIKKVVEFGKGIGEVVNGIATGMLAYANLVIPTKWNKEGKPYKFRAMTETDILNAKKNIALLLTAMADAVIWTYQDPTVLGIRSDSASSPIKFLSSVGQYQMDAVSDVTGSIVELVGNVCEIVANLADLKVPTGFNKDGKAKGYKKLTPESILQMQKNLGLMLLAIPDVISYICIDGPSAILYTDKIPKAEKNITKTLCSIGNIIDSIIDNIDGLLDPDSAKIISSAFKYKQQFKGKAADVYMTSDLIPGLFIDYGALVLGFLEINRMFAHTKFNYVNTSTAVSTVSMETTLLGAMARNISMLLRWTSTLMFAHMVTIPNLKFKDKTILPIFRGVIDLYHGFVVMNQMFVKESNGIFRNYLDRRRVQSITNLVNTLGRLSVAIAIESNRISRSIASITDVTMGKDKLAVTLSNMKGLVALISDTFEGNLTKTETKTLVNFFGFEKSISFERKINTKKILENVLWLNNVVGAFVNAAKTADKLKGEEFDTFVFTLWDLNDYATHLTDESLSKYSKEVESTERFIKAIDSIKVGKVLVLTELLEKMDRLSQHMGDLDKFTKVLSEQLASTLNQLTKQIRDAQRTIKEADRIQRQRHELIDNSIAKVQRMMDSTLQVNVTSTTTGSETTTDVTEEER